MKKYIIIFVLIFFACGLNKIHIYDQISKFDITFYENKFTIVYYDGSQVFLRRNHKKHDITIVTWNPKIYKARITEGWREVHLISKKDFFILVEKISNNKINRRNPIKKEN